MIVVIPKQFIIEALPDSCKLLDESTRYDLCQARKLRTRQIRLEFVLLLIRFRF